MSESFTFHVDPIPDWFMKRVATNEIFLCDYESDEAYCIVYTDVGGLTITNGETIIKDELLNILDNRNEWG